MDQSDGPSLLIGRRVNNKLPGILNWFHSYARDSLSFSLNTTTTGEWSSSTKSLCAVSAATISGRMRPDNGSPWRGRVLQIMDVPFYILGFLQKRRWFSCTHGCIEMFERQSHSYKLIIFYYPSLPVGTKISRMSVITLFACSSTYGIIIRSSNK